LLKEQEPRQQAQTTNYDQNGGHNKSILAPSGRPLGRGLLCWIYFLSLRL